MLFFKGRLICFEDGDGEGGGGGGGSTEGEDGSGGSESWLDNLPEDLGTNPGLQKFKEPSELAKSYLEIQKLVGKDKVVIPSENATPEEWSSFFKRLGRPDDATAYEFDTLEDPPEGYKYPAEFESNFKKWAHEDGLSAKQAKSLWSKLVGHGVSQFKDSSGKLSTLKTTQETALKEEWGANFKTRQDLASKTFNAINSKLEGDNKIPASIIKLPQWQRVFAIIGEQSAEDFLGEGGGVGVDSIMTARQAKARIQEIKEDPDYLNGDKNPSRHKRLKDEASKLYKVAYPD